MADLRPRPFEAFSWPTIGHVILTLKASHWDLKVCVPRLFRSNAPIVCDTAQSRVERLWLGQEGGMSGALDHNSRTGASGDIVSQEDPCRRQANAVRAHRAHPVRHSDNIRSVIPI